MQQLENKQTLAVYWNVYQLLLQKRLSQEPHVSMYSLRQIINETVQWS